MLFSLETPNSFMYRRLASQTLIHSSGISHLVSRKQFVVGDLRLEAALFHLFDFHASFNLFTIFSPFFNLVNEPILNWWPILFHTTRPWRARHLGLESTMLLHILNLFCGLQLITHEEFIGFWLIQPIAAISFALIPLLILIDLGFEAMLLVEVTLRLVHYFLSLASGRRLPLGYSLFHIMGNCGIIELWLHVIICRIPLYGSGLDHLWLLLSEVDLRGSLVIFFHLNWGVEVVCSLAYFVANRLWAFSRWRIASMFIHI